MGIFSLFQRAVNRTPVERNEALTLHMLTRLVVRIDDRQQELAQQIAVVVAQNKVIIDTSNAILEAVRPHEEP